MRSLLFVLALAACGTATTGPQFGDPIPVRYGASVRVPGDTLSVRFTDVPSDSRCPSGVQCVWAGEAVAVFTVGNTEQVTLTLGADAAKARAIVRGYQVALQSLAPAPTAGAPTAKGDYVATLVITSAKD